LEGTGRYSSSARGGGERWTGRRGEKAPVVKNWRSVALQKTREKAEKRESNFVNMEPCQPVCVLERKKLKVVIT